MYTSDKLLKQHQLNLMETPCRFIVQCGIIILRFENERNWITITINSISREPWIKLS